MACTNANLILLAHGSKDPKWCKPFESLTETCNGRPLLAYMDFIQPSLHSTTESLAKNGTAKIKILPMFMSSGGHVENDIPKQVNELRKRFPNIDFEVLPAITEHSKVIASMKEVIKDYAEKI